MDVAELWKDVLSTVESAADQDMCSCRALHHVADRPHFVDTVNEQMDILGMILQVSRPEDIEGNVGHFLTAVIALGYALGASDAYDVTLMSEVCIPDSLTDADFIESYGERPDDN